MADGDPGRRAARAAYVDATLNERSADLDQTVFMGLDGLFPGGLPRVTWFDRAASRHPAAVALLVRSAALLWWPVLFPLLVVVQALRLARAKRRAAARAPLRGACALVLSHRLPAVAARIGDPPPGTWIRVPWVPLQGIPPGAAVADLLAHASWQDLRGAVADAWAGARAAARAMPSWTDRLQTYTAYPWFVVWRALAGAPVDEWWHANHLDRWAVLVDRLPGTARRVMVQHGTHLCDEWRPLPARLRRVDLFYCMNETERAFFRRAVFADGAEPEVRPLPSALRLVDLEGLDPRRPRVLVIGQPVGSEKQVAILKGLARAGPRLQLLLKPHPLYGMAPYPGIEALPVRVVPEKDVFPRVDVAVCDVSTLGAEYEASGVPVVWHRRLGVEETVRRVLERVDVTGGRGTRPSAGGVSPREA
ncbi:MAG TPA: hypothetical protein VEJ18_01325 [Planctomycetota bacterium]|nr:hypothetical protein [Planctomycetota bacterium]